jgi:hypothetical protein
LHTAGAFVKSPYGVGGTLRVFRQRTEYGEELLPLGIACGTEGILINIAHRAEQFKLALAIWTKILIDWHFLSSLIYSTIRQAEDKTLSLDYTYRYCLDYLM